MTYGTLQICRACLLAAALYAPAGRTAYAEVSSGGDYSVDTSVIDNGGGAWLAGGEYAARGAIGQIVTPETQGRGGNYATRAGFYNPPRLTYQKGLDTNLALVTGEVSLFMPANAVLDRELYEVGVTRDSPGRPFWANALVDKTKVEDANRKMTVSEGPWAQTFVNDLTELYIFDEQSLTRDPLVKSGVLSLRYRDADGDGIIDYSNPPVRVDTVDAWVLDEKTRLWTLLPSMGLDLGNKTLTVKFQGPGVYNMIGALATTTEKVISFPVPFRPNGPQAGSGPGQTGTEADGIVFANLPQKGDINIYTLNGQLVKKIDIASNQFAIGQVRWDVKTAGGGKTASGVYIWRVVSGSNSKTGKLMIIW